MKRKDPTPRQLIQYGSIAGELRKWCKANNKTVHDINEMIGKDRHYSLGYHWLNGKGAPTGENLKLISKGTGIPKEKLIRQPFHDEEETNPQVIMPIKDAASLISFTVNGTGEARIRLDVTLPLHQAAPLFRLILDAGIGGNNGQTAND